MSKELKVRFQQRFDTAANWTDVNPELLAGEIGIESDTNKFKFGQTGKKWNELSYAGIDQAQLDAIEDNYHLVDVTNEDVVCTDAEARATIEAAKKGDIAVIKRKIAGDKISMTAFMYDGENWDALDGNYSAENVFTKADMTLTSAVGNYAKGYKINAGTSLETVLSGLLQKEEEPGTPSKPTASISVSGGNGEVGSGYTVPTAKLSVGGVGSYTYGPATGIVFNIGDIKLAEGAEPASATNYITNTAKVSAKTNNLLSLKATGDKVKYVDGDTKYTFSGSAAYQAATTSPVTNLGNPSKTQSAIAAGSCTIADKTATFTGWRKMFMGAVAKNAELNSATIRTATLINEKAVKGTAKEFTAPVGTEKIIIAYPRSLSTAAPTVQYFTMSWEDFGDFSLAVEKVKVADAAGTLLPEANTKDEYIVYAYTPADPLKADTKFKVTL